MHIGNFWEFFLFFGSIVFAWTQIEKSIAKRTANEVDKRLREAGLLPPLPQPKPRPQPQRLSLRESLTVVGALLALFGVAAAVGQLQAMGVLPLIRH
jgi:hypothetical protein